MMISVTLMKKLQTYEIIFNVILDNSAICGTQRTWLLSMEVSVIFRRKKIFGNVTS